MCICSLQVVRGYSKVLFQLGEPISVLGLLTEMDEGVLEGA